MHSNYKMISKIVTMVCLERGWKEYSSENDNWNLWWRTSGFPVNHNRSLYVWQYFNHIPKGASICRKDNLVRYLRCMRRVYGAIYDFIPNGYNLPLEYTKLASECSRVRSSSGIENSHKYFVENPIWICKPVAQSQGKGIYLFRKLSELNYDTNTIVQRYIEKPLLIGGYKFDLRLYVCIPSYHPVTIYMYREGLARFGTDKFCLNDLTNPFRHLTNSSINKLGPGYSEMKDRVGSGCKWTLRRLRRYFQQAGISDWLLWQKITSLITLTVLSHVSQISPTTNCFEFFGFDVLIDESLRPWLLEVNLSPALSNDCDADRLVKKPMLHDMFDLLGLPLYNTGLSIFNNTSDELDLCKGDIENNVPSLMNTISVVTVAGRWRRKQKKMSALNPTARCAMKTMRSTSANIRKNYVMLPKVHVDLRDLGSPCKSGPLPKQICDNYKRKDRGIWGNGQDWKTAKPREGGWVRTWPLTLGTCEENNTSGNIKAMVHKVSKFTKKAKELVKRHPAASESLLSEFLQEEMNMDGDIWLPPI